MSTPLLTTKLHIPPARPELVSRPRLTEALDAGVHRKLTLVSAPAGFGKTTLLGEWAHALGDAFRPTAVAWLSLDEGDNAPPRFLRYLIAALRTPATRQGEEVETEIGKGASGLLQSPQLPIEAVLTSLINDVAALPERIVLILDDYHLIEARSIHDILAFLLRHLPASMHLVIATREDPPLPLARLRARGHLTELRVADLRFTSSEASEFLNRMMGLDLSAEDVAALERRTEGWIAGLQLAAISMRGRNDVAGFIHSFTGSHRFVMDYLLEEVLRQQPENVEAFLLRTSILDRLCGPLCDAVRFGNREAARPDAEESAAGPGTSQAILEMLERANLFIVPLDSERRWYRYHHLFADLLRQRLQQRADASPGDKELDAAELHRRASVWYEQNGLEIEAFKHAVAANDVERAARLVEGGGMTGERRSPGKLRLPVHFRGAVGPVLNWLSSVPTSVLDARPSLWVMYASALSMTGQLAGVEEKLQAAEAALERMRQGTEPDEKTRNLIGHIAAIRALLAATEHQAERSIAQSQRALKYLHPDNLAVRTATIWKMGIAYQMQGDRNAAGQAYAQAMAISQASGNTIIEMSAATGLGQVQEADNQLHVAAETYRHVQELAGDPPLPFACEAYLGLARIHYQWNKMDTARECGRLSVELARQIESIHTFALCQVFLARLQLTEGDAARAAAALDEADRFVRDRGFALVKPDIAAARVLVLLRQGDLAAAADLAEAHKLPLSRARVCLAQEDPSAALAALEPYRREAGARGWKREQLEARILEAIAHHAHGERDVALEVLADALALAEPGGLIRIFVDEGAPMKELLSAADARRTLPDYVSRLLAAFEAKPTGGETPDLPSDQPLVEPLSPRELEVLQLIAEGLSNREIGERLFIAVSTVKGHNRNIYGKLQVERRTEAVARARDLGLL